MDGNRETANLEDGNARAFVVRAAENGWPIPGVYNSLLQGRATIGWSWLDSQDLRVIAKVVEDGGRLDEAQRSARRCLGFLEKPKSGDLLLYPHQPETRQFFAVVVDGDYDYATTGDDFRSYRPCKVKTPVPVSLDDAVVPSQLKRDLGRPPRFYEIHETRALETFLASIDQVGNIDRSSVPGLVRIHAALRNLVRVQLPTEFAAHDLSRKFCSELFERMGYKEIEVREGPTEAGSDLVVSVEDPLLPEDVRVGVQAFAYTDEVTESELARKLEQLVAGWEYNDLSYGVLLTTGKCTAAGRHKIAEHNRAKRDRLVLLIDADDLSDLFLRHFPPEK